MGISTIRPSRAENSGLPKVSFEFFPPKNEKMEKNLWSSIERLAPISPAFVSVTYGAGGTTRERTHATVKRLLDETSLVPAAHLTCVGAPRVEVDEIVSTYWQMGVRNIVALRGDPQGGMGTAYVPEPGTYSNAADLVSGISRIGNFDISVSAYPEKHPESATIDADIDMLAAKVDAGAHRAITQFFFDNDVYFRYLDAVQARGLDIPIIPGILPIVHFGRMSSFAEKCGTTVPGWLAERFEGLDDDPETRQLIAVAVAAEQVIDLLDRGVDTFHFYTMNKADMVYAICRLLGLGRASVKAAV